MSPTSVHKACCIRSRQQVAQFLFSRRCSDSVCFLMVFCRVDNVVGRRTPDPQAEVADGCPLRCSNPFSSLRMASDSLIV
jgi:hypothetical protein